MVTTAILYACTYSEHSSCLLRHTNDFTPNLWNQKFFSIVVKHLGGRALSTYTTLKVLFSAKKRIKSNSRMRKQFFMCESFLLLTVPVVQLVGVLWVSALYSD